MQTKKQAYLTRRPFPFCSFINLYMCWMIYSFLLRHAAEQLRVGVCALRVSHVVCFCGVTPAVYEARSSRECLLHLAVTRWGRPKRKMASSACSSHRYAGCSMGAGKLANTALFGGVRAIFDLIILTLRFEAAADLTYLYSIYESLRGLFHCGDPLVHRVSGRAAEGSVIRELRIGC